MDRYVVEVRRTTAVLGAGAAALLLAGVAGMPVVLALMTGRPLLALGVIPAAVAGWFALRSAFGAGATVLDDAGMTLSSGGFVRHPVRLAWSQVRHVWIGSDTLSASRVLANVYTDPDRPADPGPPPALRAAGAPFLFEVPDEAGLRAALAARGVSVADGAPEEAAVAAGPVPRREFRAPLGLRLLPAGLVVLGVLLGVAAGFGRLSSAALLALVALLVARRLARRLHGRTVIDDEGIRTGALRVPWPHVSAVHVWHRGLRSHGRLVHTDPAGNVLLRGVVGQGEDALREACRGRARFHAWRSGAVADVALWTVLVALVAVALLAGVDRPWARHWWPGVALATDLPDPCAGADPTFARRSVGTADAGLRACFLERDGQRLQIDYERWADVDEAKLRYTSAVRHRLRGPATDAGIADVSTMTSGPPDSAQVLVRRANVTVRIAGERDQVLTHARNAAAAIVLR